MRNADKSLTLSVHRSYDWRQQGMGKTCWEGMLSLLFIWTDRNLIKLQFPGKSCLIINSIRHLPQRFHEILKTCGHESHKKGK